MAMQSLSRKSGKGCNSEKLYKIIQAIKPSVIFEELLTSLFDLIYMESRLPVESLEIKTIKKYLINHRIEHTPVDIETDRNPLHNKFENLLATFLKYDA